MAFDLRPVENPGASGNVVAAAYDAESETLRIQFKGGNVMYDYHGVTPELYQAFGEAPSAGRFEANILRGSCPASKVKEEKDAAE